MTPSTLAAPPAVVPGVVAQHLEDAVSLRALRSRLLRSPDVTLNQLVRADERLAAHLDGLRLAGEHATRLSRVALGSPGVGEVFVATVLAIEQRDTAQIDRLLSLIGVVPDAARAMSSAFGWTPRHALRGLTTELLGSSSAAGRRLGLAACAQHRVDPAGLVAEAAQHDDAALRTRALRMAGELGRVDLLALCLEHLGDDAPACRMAAAWAGVLLGDRSDALQALHDIAAAPGPAQLEALPLFLASADPEASRTLVRALATRQAPVSTLIRAAGWAGDPQVVPWLIKHMDNEAHAPWAGEAFSFVTGADLVALNLEKPGTAAPANAPADAVPAEPIDDADTDLPWPDAEKISTWWQAKGSRFQPGTRYFVGEPPSVAHCISVLKNGFQRQRIAAAEYLGLLQPGTPLFNVAAPAWRQKRLLAQMDA